MSDKKAKSCLPIPHRHNFYTPIPFPFPPTIHNSRQPKTIPLDSEKIHKKRSPVRRQQRLKDGLIILITNIDNKLVRMHNIPFIQPRLKLISTKFTGKASSNCACVIVNQPIKKERNEKKKKVRP